MKKTRILILILASVVVIGQAPTNWLAFQKGTDITPTASQEYGLHTFWAGMKTVVEIKFITNTFKASPPENPELICTISNRFAVVVVPDKSTNKVFIESIGCLCEEKEVSFFIATNSVFVTNKFWSK